MFTVRLSVSLRPLLLGASLMTGCSNPQDPNATIYVVMDTQRAKTFVADLMAVSTRRGLYPHNGSATSDTGVVLMVVEAQSTSMRLWAQNLPLSPGECTKHNEAEVDPGQFIVSVVPRFALPLRKSAVELMDSIAAQLRGMNYEVLRKPVLPCSPSALAAASRS
jgi:hypothetical protein